MTADDIQCVMSMIIQDSVWVFLCVDDMCHGNTFHQDGDTALHRACHNDHTAVAELLLRHGASHTCRNKACKD